MARLQTDINNWYWIVAGDASKVYSSAVGDYVLPTNPAYIEWQAMDGVPTSIANETLLGEVLGRNLAPRPIPPVILDTWKEAQAAKMTPIDVLPQVIFMMENQIRALQGNPPLTFAQFRAFVKGLM